MTARLDRSPPPPPVASGDVEAWAACGGMAISGPRHGALFGPPARLVDGVRRSADRLAASTARWGSPVEVDGLALLTERANDRGFHAGGRVSCGGSAQMLPTSDGWAAVTLSRATDRELLPAFFELLGARTTAAASPSWPEVAVALAGANGPSVSSAAELLGLAVGVLAERRPTPDHGVEVTRLGITRRRSGSIRVLDLSGLWAGPLCASLLGRAGAAVTKVESIARPDAALTGDPDLFGRLNVGKHRRAIDMSTAEGRTQLLELLSDSDVVVESSRRRALEQFGISALDVLRAPAGPSIWVSITAHGRASNRVGFGDDAAVAGGLIVAADDGPWFCGDAIADPLSGLAAAAAASDLLAEHAVALVDVSMAGVAAAHAGPTAPVEVTEQIAP